MHLSALLSRPQRQRRPSSDGQEQQQQQQQQQDQPLESSNNNSNTSNDTSSSNSNNSSNSNHNNSSNTSSSLGASSSASAAPVLRPGLGGGLGALIGADFLPHRWAWSQLSFCQGKAQLWGALAALLFFAVLCTSIFEAKRLTTHVLRSPCTITGSEVVDIGTCTICDDGDPGICEVHPIATARIAVNYLPMHQSSNVTGWVWYCRAHATGDPCRRRPGFEEESASLPAPMGMSARRGHIPCSVGDVHTFLRTRAIEGRHHSCFYTSQDVEGEDVWFSMPSPGDVDHAWFERQIQYPILLGLAGLILLSTLLGCLALEGAELWASGLIP